MMLIVDAALHAQDVGQNVYFLHFAVLPRSSVGTITTTCGEASDDADLLFCHL